MSDYRKVYNFHIIFDDSFYNIIRNCFTYKILLTIPIMTKHYLYTFFHPINMCKRTIKCKLFAWSFPMWLHHVLSSTFLTIFPDFLCIRETQSAAFMVHVNHFCFNISFNVSVYVYNNQPNIHAWIHIRSVAICNNVFIDITLYVLSFIRTYQNNYTYKAIDIRDIHFEFSNSKP